MTRQKISGRSSPTARAGTAIGRRLATAAVMWSACCWLAACQSPGPAAEASREGSAPSLTAPGPLAGASAPAAAASRPTLVEEQRRLSALFRGTPVVFSLQSDTRMQVEVPLRHSFDTGKSIVKPPLAAVLDRLAVSQAGGGSRIAVSAPGDRVAPARAASAAAGATGAASGAGAKVAGAKGAAATSPAVAANPTSPATARQERLAAERRRSMTGYLVGRGLEASRLSAGPAVAPPGGVVRLLVEDRPAP